MWGLCSAVEVIRRVAGPSRAAAVVGVCSAGFLCICPGASAAPTWLSPANLSETGHNSSGPQVAVDPDGEAIAVWEFYNGSHEIAQASVRPASGGSWQTPVNLSEASHDASALQVAIDPQGEAIAVWDFYNGSHEIVQASVRPASGGSWQTPVNLSEASHEGYAPQIVISPAGEAIAVWEFYNGSHAITQASVRPASGGSWQTPVNLSDASHEAYEPQLAINAHGEAIAVWQFNNGSNQAVQASARPSAGGSWQTPVTLSEAGHNAQQAHVGVNGEGEAIVTWDLFSGSNEVVQASARSAPGSAWQTPTTLAEGNFNLFFNEQRVAIDSQGDAIAVWSLLTGAHEVVDASVRPGSGGSWQTPVTLAGATHDAQEPRVAVDPQGEAIATWSFYNGSYTAVQASVLTGPGGSWSTPQNLSEAGPSAFQSEVAINSQGNAIAVWDRSNGSDEVIQGAAYVAAGPLLNEVSIPASGTVGQSLSFSATPLDAWASLGQTSWSFGDGAVANGASVNHTYASPGSYEVAVKSADALGNITTKKGKVVVGAPPSKKESPAQEVAAVTTTAALPVLKLLTKAPQPLINAHSLTLKVTCGGSACSTSASGWVRLPGVHTVWRLNGLSGAIAGNGVGKVRLFVPRGLRHAVRSYLRRHPHYEVILHLTVTLMVNGRISQSVSAALPIWTYPRFR
jgi:hypothetical protein